jgi:hypothetical protein
VDVGCCNHSLLIPSLNFRFFKIYQGAEMLFNNATYRNSVLHLADLRLESNHGPTIGCIILRWWTGILAMMDTPFFRPGVVSRFNGARAVFLHRPEGVKP